MPDADPDIDRLDRSEETNKPWVKRVWVERSEHPIRYRRYTGRGYDGTDRIFLDFERPAGQDQLHSAVKQILAELKTLGSSRTGLKYVGGSTYERGLRWQLLDTPTGRTAADIVDARISDLTGRPDAGHGRGG